MDDSKGGRFFLFTILLGLAVAGVVVVMLRNNGLSLSSTAPTPMFPVVTNELPAPPPAQQITQTEPPQEAPPPPVVIRPQPMPRRPDPDIAERLAQRRAADKAIEVRVIRDAEIQLRNDEQNINDAYTRAQITRAEREHIEELRETFFRKYGHQP